MLADVEEFPVSWQPLKMKAAAMTKKADTNTNFTACLICLFALLRPIDAGVVNVLVRCGRSRKVGLGSRTTGQHIKAAVLVAPRARGHIDEVIAVKGALAVVAHLAAVGDVLVLLGD